MTIPNNVGYVVGAEGLLLKYNTSLGVAENSKSIGFRVSPNPAHNIINLQFNKHQHRIPYWFIMFLSRLYRE